MRFDIVNGNNFLAPKKRIAQRSDPEDEDSCEFGIQCLGEENCKRAITAAGRCIFKDRSGCCMVHDDLDRVNISPAGGLL